MPMFRVFERADAIRIYNIEAKDEAHAASLVEEGEVEFDYERFLEFCVHEVREISE